MSEVELDPAALARAATWGAVGRDWVAGLPMVLAELAQEWGLTLGASLSGGTGSYVTTVTTREGGPAVLKVTLPDPSFGQQVGTMVRAEGRAYAVVQGHDAGRSAVLLEALGRPVETDDVDPAPLLQVGARLLLQAWQVPRDPADAEAPDVDDKAAGLIELIRDELNRIDEVVDQRVVDRALHHLERRQASWDPERAVVVHGDPHVNNMLPVLAPRPGAVGGYVFVDPDGFLADPAYDLGVLVREWCTHLLQAPDPTREVEGWCRLLAGVTGLDEEVIWEWGYIERVTTGLHLMGLGLVGRGRPFLDVAARLR